MDQSEIAQAAREIGDWLQDAVGDCTFEASEDDIIYSYGDKYAKKIRDARRNGVVDLTGWLADEFYSDPDIVSDLVGDRLFDSASTDEDRCAVARVLRNGAHEALRIACDRFIEGRG